MPAELEQEAEKMRRVPGIVFAQANLERVPRIAGTGLEVFEIIGVYQGVDKDWDRLKRAFEFLSDDQLKTALHYYERYPQEVDARLAEEARTLQQIKRERSADPYHR
jgi:uncharacterized protein (DUF433 family)